MFFKKPTDSNINIQGYIFLSSLQFPLMINNKDVITLTLFLLQDVTIFYLAAGLEGIFTEAAETCLFICVQKLIQHWCSQREQIFNTEKDGLVFLVGINKKKK